MSSGIVEVDIGPVGDETLWARVPALSADAVTLVVSFKLSSDTEWDKARVVMKPEVRWMLADSVSGDADWFAVENTWGSVWNIISADQYLSVGRYVVPFAPNLALAVECGSGVVPFRPVRGWSFPSAHVRVLWRAP
jgi:hypothetical protein